MIMASEFKSNREQEGVAQLLKILLLEDQPFDAELTLRALRKEGFLFEFRLAKNQAEYLAALPAFSPDLILADYTLPDYDGMTALEAAQHELPGVPFIFVSGTLGEETAIEALKRGAMDYVLKHRLGRLGMAVRRALKDVEERHRMARLEAAREKLIKELQDALAHVKQLRGMLPICSSCKKIRDDRGYWEQIELYVQEHTDAMFSHGICPECANKFYSEMEDELPETARFIQ